MSNVQIGVGPGAVDSLALVSVDGVTIVGDGADTPLSAPGGGIASAKVGVSAGASFESNSGFASVNYISTGVVNLILATPPTDVDRIIAIVTPGAKEESFSWPALMWRADVGADGNIVVRTFNASGVSTDESFFISVSLAASV